MSTVIPPETQIRGCFCSRHREMAAAIVDCLMDPSSPANDKEQANRDLSVVLNDLEQGEAAMQSITRCCLNKMLKGDGAEQDHQEAVIRLLQQVTARFWSNLGVEIILCEIVEFLQEHYLDVNSRSFCCERPPSLPPSFSLLRTFAMPCTAWYSDIQATRWSQKPPSTAI